MVKKLPANAGDTGSIPSWITGPERSHKQLSPHAKTAEPSV